MNPSARPRPPQHWSACRRRSARACVRCPPSLAFQIEGQAVGYARDAFERRTEIEIADAFAEHLYLGRRQHAFKARLLIDDVVGSLAIVVFKQFLQPDQRLLDSGGGALRWAHRIVAALA